MDVLQKQVQSWYIRFKKKMKQNLSHAIRNVFYQELITDFNHSDDQNRNETIEKNVIHEASQYSEVADATNRVDLNIMQSTDVLNTGDFSDQTTFASNSTHVNTSFEQKILEPIQDLVLELQKLYNDVKMSSSRLDKVEEELIKSLARETDLERRIKELEKERAVG